MDWHNIFSVARMKHVHHKKSHLESSIFKRRILGPEYDSFPRKDVVFSRSAGHTSWGIFLQTNERGLLQCLEGTKSQTWSFLKSLMRRRRLGVVIVSAADEQN